MLNTVIPRYVNRLCLTPASLRQAYRLRYRSYFDRQFIPKNDDELFYDLHDAMPNSLTFAVYDGTVMAGTIRACIYDPTRQWLNIPAQHVYPDEFQMWSEECEVIIEWNRFVISPQYTDRAMRVELALLGSVPFVSSYFPKASFMAAVRANHVKFYSRFGYERLTGFVRYHGLAFDTTLMAMKWGDHSNRIRTHRVFSRCFEYMPDLGALDVISRRQLEARLC